MRYVTAFVRFWYDFIVGDDWRVALGIVAAIALTAVLAAADLSAWWVMPIGVVLTLFASLRRVARSG